MNGSEARNPDTNSGCFRERHRGVSRILYPLEEYDDIHEAHFQIVNGLQVALTKVQAAE